MIFSNFHIEHYSNNQMFKEQMSSISKYVFNIGLDKIRTGTKRRKCSSRKYKNDMYRIAVKL